MRQAFSTSERVWNDERHKQQGVIQASGYASR